MIVDTDFMVLYNEARGVSLSNTLNRVCPIFSDTSKLTVGDTVDRMSINEFA